jgi:hypothetical protein
MVDNTAAISTASNGILTSRNRHYVVKYYWLHEQVDFGRLEIQYVSTKDQLADILTKPLLSDVITRFNSAIGLA